MRRVIFGMFEDSAICARCTGNDCSSIPVLKSLYMMQILRLEQKRYFTEQKDVVSFLICSTEHRSQVYIYMYKTAIDFPIHEALILTPSTIFPNACAAVVNSTIPTDHHRRFSHPSRTGNLSSPNNAAIYETGTFHPRDRSPKLLWISVTSPSPNVFCTLPKSKDGLSRFCSAMRWTRKRAQSDTVMSFPSWALESMEATRSGFEVWLSPCAKSRRVMETSCSTALCRSSSSRFRHATPEVSTWPGERRANVRNIYANGLVRKAQSPPVAVVGDWWEVGGSWCSR